MQRRLGVPPQHEFSACGLRCFDRCLLDAAQEDLDPASAPHSRAAHADQMITLGSAFGRGDLTKPAAVIDRDPVDALDVQLLRQVDGQLLRTL